MAKLEEFRAQKDVFFKTHPQSPLTAEQQEGNAPRYWVCHVYNNLNGAADL